jgi:hypothetical protein
MLDYICRLYKLSNDLFQIKIPVLCQRSATHSEIILLTPYILAHSS